MKDQNDQLVIMGLAKDIFIEMSKQDMINRNKITITYDIIFKDLWSLYKDPYKKLGTQDEERQPDL